MRRPRLTSGPMPVVAALAWNTFLEAVRDKILYLLLFFGVFVFAASRLLSPLALGEGRRVTLDLGFTALSAFGCLATIFVGHQLIFREVERKTLYFLFSRPLRRGDFIWGKYLGLLLTLASAVVLMGGILAGVLMLSGYAFDGSLIQAVGMVLVELAILAALAVLLATMASPVLAGLFTLAAWLIGHGSGDLWTLLGAAQPGGIHGVVRCISWIVPRLDLYGNILPVVQGTLYPPAQMLYGLLYACTYSTAALLLATLVLRRRELSL